MEPTSKHGTLQRRLGLPGAILTGLGSMLGAGVFVSIAYAADAAGPEVLWAILIAAAVALCNGLSSAQLAAAHPVAGGTYEYGYRLIGPQAGFLSGWLFLCAKSASAASAALAFSGYLLTLIDTGNRSLLVLGALVLVGALTYLLWGGLQRTMKFNLAIVATTLLALLLFIGAGLPRVITQGLPGKDAFTPGFFPREAVQGLIKSERPAPPATVAEIPRPAPDLPPSAEEEFLRRELERVQKERERLAAETAPLTPEEIQAAKPPPPTPQPETVQKPREQTSPVMLAAALMFVAFTGYGRIATMGEEVMNPKRTIPIAIGVTIALSCLVYVGVGAVYLAWLEPARAHLSEAGLAYQTARNSADTAPLALIAQVLPLPGLTLLVTLGAFTALLGVLLNLILGLSRVWLAMGRRKDMPDALARLDGPELTPRLAIITAGGVVGLLCFLGDIKIAWSFSAFCVLLYYSVTNAAALRLPEGQRMFPNWIAALGLGGCILLASAVPPVIWVAGLCVLGTGIVWQTFVNPPPKEKKTISG
jgi:amino acid transporter